MLHIYCYKRKGFQEIIFTFVAKKCPPGRRLAAFFFQAAVLCVQKEKEAFILLLEPFFVAKNYADNSFFPFEKELEKKKLSEANLNNCY